MSTDSIIREISIHAPAERVWSLITEAEHLGTWFGDAGASVDLRPGGGIEVRWDGHQLSGVVDAVEPTTRFAFRWRQIESTPDSDLADGSSTLVEFLLASDGETTRVTVVESGFDSLHLPEADRTAMFDSHTQGWANEMGELEAYGIGSAV